MIVQENISWCEKYRGKCFKDIRGQELAVDKAKSFLRIFPRKKALVLHGPSGTGKTSLAYVIACEMDAEILELNASDLRDKQKIAEIIGAASMQKSLFKRNKIILVDEIDGISARDRGGLSELLSIMEKTAFPIIITANDIWQQKFGLLRSKSELVQLKEIDYKIVLEILKSICEKEDCFVSNDVLISVAIKARGDIRAAINDLQMLSKTGVSELAREIGERDKEYSIFNAMQYIFKNSRLDSKMISIFDDVNMNINEIFLWIEENIPLEYKGVELEKAFNALSLADVFRGRIHRQQHWRFLVYENFFLGAAVAGVKKYNRTGFTKYKKPTRILKIWLQNQRAKKKKLISQKYARYCHISTRQAMKDFLLLRIILKNEKIRRELKLSEEEIEYLDRPILP